MSANRLGIFLIFVLASIASAQPATQPATRPVKTQAELETDLAAMLSGATLDGSFTSTGPGRDPHRLTNDKYTLGTVRKLAGKLWLIPARIQYGNRDITVPITLPIEWAGDTPVIVVDNLTIPGMGTFSARVMFFDGHYSGYWKHGEVGGNMFGVIRPAGDPATRPSSTNPAAAP
jgi:hypothetical protein